MTIKHLTVIVDADAIVAQAFLGDSNHVVAMKTAKKLKDIEAKIIYPVTAILEAVTVLQTKLNSKPLAYEIVTTLIENARIIEINGECLVKAVGYFSPVASKKNTLFDCVVAAIAELNGAEVIFSFDKFYKAKGFKLALELL